MTKVRSFFFLVFSKFYFDRIDVDEWTTDEPRSTILNNTEWSIEKILYPDWLYRDSTRKQLNTSTFTDLNSYQTFETNESTLSSPSHGKRTISLHSQSSPKQVRFDACEEQIHSYRHLSTTIEQFRTGTTTTMMIANHPTHQTFI